MLKLFRCEHCGNIVEMVSSSGVPVVCCGENMKELVPNTTDAATEKHVPVVNVNGKTINVKVGEVTHPMTAEHYIQFIILETDKGIQKKYLDPAGSPEAVFEISDGEKIIAAYEYCNLHGFWAKKS